MTYYQEIHKDKLEYDLQQRYAEELSQLETFGFDDVRHTREVVFPFSALIFFPLYPFFKYKREIFQIEAPLRFVIFNPLALNYPYGTYAHVFGLGVKFITQFTDETLLTSANYVTTRVVKPKRKLYAYGGTPMPLSEAWKRHQGFLHELEADSCEVDTDLTLPKFEKVMHRDDKAMLFGR